MPEKILYTAFSTATGGRADRICTGDGFWKPSWPSQKKWAAPVAQKPTQDSFFASGYAAYYEGAICLVADETKVALSPGTHVTAPIGIGPRKEGDFGPVVKLEAHLDGVDKAKARESTQNVHKNIYPYSHATRGNVAVEIAIV